MFPDKIGSPLFEIELTNSQPLQRISSPQGDVTRYEVQRLPAVFAPSVRVGADVEQSNDPADSPETRRPVQGFPAFAVPFFHFGPFSPSSPAREPCTRPISRNRPLGPDPAEKPSRRMPCKRFSRGRPYLSTPEPEVPLLYLPCQPANEHPTPGFSLNTTPASIIRQPTPGTLGPGSRMQGNRRAALPRSAG